MTLISGYTLHIFQFSDIRKSSINVNTCIKAKGMFKDNVDIGKLDDSFNDFDYVYWKVKVKFRCWAVSALQPYRLIVLWPPKEFLHSSLEALHTKWQERPQLAKEGTIDGI
jgi:hypothetical protein